MTLCKNILYFFSWLIVFPAFYSGYYIRLLYLQSLYWTIKFTWSQIIPIFSFKFYNYYNIYFVI